MRGPLRARIPGGPTEIDFYLGDREEDYLLEVGGEVVSISITATEEEFDGFRPGARKVLDTVEWEVGS